MFVLYRGTEGDISQEVEFTPYPEPNLSLGCGSLYLVFLAVPSADRSPSQAISTKGVALIHAALVFLSLGTFSLASVSLGSLVLRVLRTEMDSDTEHLLVCAGVGVIVIEIMLFGVEVTQQVRRGCFVILGVLCIFLLAEIKAIAARFSRILRAGFYTSRVDFILILLIGIILGIEFLTSLAPLTGSDALHYHFTSQKLILEHGFYPDWSITNSFLCGQHHLLILFGLALGSEQVAMALIFLGGLLTALSMARLAFRWSCCRTASAITLLFLLTPVVFWQISSSGAPDI